MKFQYVLTGCVCLGPIMMCLRMPLVNHDFYEDVSPAPDESYRGRYLQADPPASLLTKVGTLRSTIACWSFPVKSTNGQNVDVSELT